MSRSIPRSLLRVFFASSVEGLDLMLDCETKGLASGSIAVDHLLPGRCSTSQSISQLEMRQFESELRTRASLGTGATSTGGEPSLHEKRRSPPPAGRMDVLDRRRLEIELGTPGDHDMRFTFTLPTSLPQVHAWMQLRAKVQDGALQPEVVPEEQMHQSRKRSLSVRNARLRCSTRSVSSQNVRLAIHALPLFHAGRTASSLFKQRSDFLALYVLSVSFVQTYSIRES